MGAIDGASEWLTRRVTRMLFWSLDVPDQVDDTEAAAQSSDRAVREALALIVGAVWFTWVTDATVGYSLPHQAYGLVLAANASVLFATSDISEGAEYLQPVSEDGHPSLYFFVRRTLGLFFFTFGFTIQYLTLYIGAIDNLPLPSTPLGDVGLEFVLNVLLVLCTAVLLLQVLPAEEYSRAILVAVGGPLLVVAVAGLVTLVSPIFGQIIAVLAILVYQFLFLSKVASLFLSEIQSKLQLAMQPLDGEQPAIDSRSEDSSGADGSTPSESSGEDPDGQGERGPDSGDTRHGGGDEP